MRDLREHILRHHNPGVAAGGRQERLFAGGHVGDKFLRLLHRADVRAAGHLIDVRKADLAQCGAHLFRGGQRAKLSDKGRSHLGDDLVAALDGLNQLEDLGLVRDGAERAADQALAAGDALVVVDFGAAVLVAFDGVDAAGGRAGALAFDDGRIGAGLGAAAALDALGLVNLGAAVDDADRLDRADHRAGVGQAVAAQVGDGVAGLLAGVAGEGNDVDERRFIKHVGDGAVVHSLRNRRVLVHRTQRQSDCQAQPLTDDGALLKDAVAVVGDLSGNDGVRQLLDPGIVPVLIGQTGNLGKDLSSDFGDRRCDPSHRSFPPVLVSCLFFILFDFWIYCSFSRTQSTM